MGEFDRESMLEMFTFEMNQLLEELEKNIILIEEEGGFTMDRINDIFRVMHTIKGSAAMMLYDNISKAAHAIEDLFFYLRDEGAEDADDSRITDLVLETLDFIKEELAKIEANVDVDGDSSEINEDIKSYLDELKGAADDKNNKDNEKKADNSSEGSGDSWDGAVGTPLNHFKAVLHYDPESGMENIRAFTVVKNLEGINVEHIDHEPKDLEDEKNADVIKANGFKLDIYTSKTYNDIEKVLNEAIYLRELFLQQVDKDRTNKYKAVLRFAEGSEMENVRAYGVVHNLKNYADKIETVPADLIDESSIEIVRNDGLKLTIYTGMGYDDLYNVLSETIYLQEFTLEEISGEESEAETSSDKEGSKDDKSKDTAKDIEKKPSVTRTQTHTQHVISVNVNKLDELLKLMGELVISEAMVTQNPEIENLELDSFHKEATQLRKIIKDIQDNVMSMRMVSLATTFFKMHRIVRDMCKQLGKEISLEISGENTEVDKNIIEHISDPLMHIIRNSADHGIEMPEERKKAGKSEKGVISLEAKNSGSDVIITVRDDGAGLNRDKILAKAVKNGLLKKSEEEYTDKEIYQFIFMAGFSTTDKVTSFSGRGVGMDVVNKNLEVVGGNVSVESVQGEGSTFTMKIPLTLAIIEGMLVKMGGAKYTIPIIAITRSLKPSREDVFIDPAGNEMIVVNGETYNLIRLYEFFGVPSEITDIEDGIVIMVENGEEMVCLFADALIGEQQVVVKSMPKYIKKPVGISGCTLLGNGDISLIIDVAGFFN